MADVRDWQAMKESFAVMLAERTGEDLSVWKERVSQQDFQVETDLREWLTRQGVTGYPQTLLVWEQFGYPDWIRATADDLIDGQYADRPQLRPIFDAILAVVGGLGDMAIQARKTYVSLVTKRRTFARVQPTTRNRVDVFLRLSGQPPGGRLLPSKTHEHMPVQIGISSVDEVDDEVAGWLQRAYDENR